MRRAPPTSGARASTVFHARKPRVSIEFSARTGRPRSAARRSSAWFAARCAIDRGDDGDEESERGGEIEVYDGAGGREAVCSADEAAAGCDASRPTRTARGDRGWCEDEDVGVAGDGDARAVVRGGGVFFDRGERGRGEDAANAEGDTPEAAGGTLWGRGEPTRRMARRRSSHRRARAPGEPGGVGEDQVEEMHAPALSDDGKGGAPVAPLGGEVGALLEDRPRPRAARRNAGRGRSSGVQPRLG